MILAKMFDIEIYYMAAISIATIFLLIIMSLICINNIVFKKYHKVRFLALFILSSLFTLVDCGATFVEHSENGNLVVLGYILKFIEYSIPPLMPLIMSRILRGKDNQIHPYIIYGVYEIVILCLICTKSICVFDPVTAEFSRQTMGFIFYVVSIMSSSLFLLIDSILLSRKMLSKFPFALFIFFISLVACSIMQLVFREVHFAYLFIAVLMVIFYDYTSTLYSQIDGLTGLFSQYCCIKRIKNIKHGEAVFIMDADNLKDINDTFGHLAGDKVLQRTAKQIQTVFGKHGTCYRYGGDEFIAIIKAGTNFESLLDDFRAEVNKESNSAYFTTISIGYEVYDKGADIAEFEEAADKKMYLDKIKNKTKIVKE